VKLAEALSLIQKAPAGGTAYPVLLACGFSPLHLLTFLRAHLQILAADSRVEIQTGLYGSVADTMEQMGGSSYPAATLFLEWADLDARLGYRSLGGWGNSGIAGVINSAEATLNRLANAIQKKGTGTRLVVSLPTLGLPPGFHTVGWQASAAEMALENAVSGFAQRISLVPGVLLVNRQRLAMVSPAAGRYDFRSDLNAGFPYSIPHTDALAGAMAGLLKLAPPKKGLISDLDDTMWRGIVGEEGPNGVSWDLAGHAQVHGLYQQMLQALAEQGVLIGVASRNKAETAEKALGRSDLVVKRDKIFPVEIHWEAKSGSVGRILKTWNVGADSVVFVDDSPMEIEEVRVTHPDVECILFPKNDYAGAFAFFQKMRDLFGKPALSDEDAFRLKSIRNSQQFLEGAGDGDLAEQFLSSAEATVTFEMNPAADDTRVLDLVNKTNQFNLNGKRFNEAEWLQLTKGPGTFLAAISYQDKFGPLGKISVVAGRQYGQVLKIEAWVMSCRAFSRRIEHQVLRQIFEKTGVEQIQFEYSETAKNSPTGDFLKVLLGDVEAAPALKRAAFEEKCPALYHRVDYVVRALVGKD
jgi:FkbH-like protein